MLAFVTGFTWKDGRADRHVDELFGQLTNLSGLPSPLTFLSLDEKYNFLHDKFSRVEDAELFASRETGVSYRH